MNLRACVNKKSQFFLVSFLTESRNGKCAAYIYQQILLNILLRIADFLSTHRSTNTHFRYDLWHFPFSQDYIWLVAGIQNMLMRLGRHSVCSSLGHSSVICKILSKYQVHLVLNVRLQLFKKLDESDGRGGQVEPV